MGSSLSRAVDGSALAGAAAANDLASVTKILEANPHALLFKTLLQRRTPLMLAAENGAVECLFKLLWAAERLLGGAAYQAHIDGTSARGSTALSLAAKHGHTVCVRLLLEDSANPLPANSRGNTALHMACSGGHAACVDLLLRAWVRSSNGTVVRAADAMVSDGYGEERFVDSHNQAGKAPLHLAVLAGSVEAATVLMRCGASPDVPVLRDSAQMRLPYLCAGSTPLHIAAFLGNARLCLVLLDGQWRNPGVELRRLRNARGLTPLNCALLAGHHSLARVLVESRLPASVLTLSRRALDVQFPSALRAHLLGILHRASLLVQLREMSRQWKEQGLAKPSDESVRMVGLAELRPGSIDRLVRLVQLEGSSLRDIIAGLEEAFAPQHAQQQQQIPGGGPAAAPGSWAGHGLSQSSAGSLPREEEEEEGEGEGEEEQGEEGGQLGLGGQVEAGGDILLGRGRVGAQRQQGRAGRRRGSRSESRQDVDWTLLEAQRMMALDPRAVSLSSRRRARSRRSRQSLLRDTALPQAVLEVQHSADSVMPPFRRRERQRSRESRQQVLTELISSVQSAEAALAAGAVVERGAGSRAAAPSTGSRGAGPGPSQLRLHRDSGSSSEASGSNSSSSGSSRGSEQASPRHGQATQQHAEGGGAAGDGSSSASAWPEPGSGPAAAVQAGEAPSEGGSTRECFICMDSAAEVAVAGCGHALCFLCAAKVAAQVGHDPSCPFCRGPIQRFELLAGARLRQQGQHAQHDPV